MSSVITLTDIKATRGMSRWEGENEIVSFLQHVSMNSWSMNRSKQVVKVVLKENENTTGLMRRRVGVWRVGF